MIGPLGIGANLNRWSEQDFAMASRTIAYYKSIRATGQEGGLCGLFSPREDGLTANQYVAADGEQPMVFVFQHAQQFNRPAPTVDLSGLDENALCRIQPIDDKLVEWPPVAGGGWLAPGGSGLNYTVKAGAPALAMRNSCRGQNFSSYAHWPAGWRFRFSIAEEARTIQPRSTA